MATKVGLIAEDLSDVEVLKLLVKKLTTKSISFAHFVGKGCGPLKRKTPGWCKNLKLKGCTKIVLVHDLDRNHALDLRAKLESILNSSTDVKSIVVIPVEELEAWLLSDSSAISSALSISKPIKTIHHPETISSPKEFIRDTVWNSSNHKKQYVNSVHNKLIANIIDVKLIDRKCPSFKGFAKFFS